MNKKIRTLLLVAICALALYLQTNSLLKGMSHDDVWTIEIINHNIPSIASMGVLPPDSVPFYYILLHFWTGIIGINELSLRLFSVLWGVLSIPLVFLVGTRLFNNKVGLMSALLMATSVHFIEVSQLINAYTLFLFLSILSILFFFEYTKNHRKRDIILFTIVTILNLYTHYFSFLLLGVQILILMHRKKRDISYILIIFIASLPLLLRLPAAFLANRVSTEPNPCHLLAFFNSIHFTAIHYIMLVLLFALFTIGLKACYKLHKRTAISSALLFFMPMTIAVLISCLSIFKVRYYIFVLPIFFIMVSFALFRLKPGIRALTLAAIIILSFIVLADYYKRPFSADWVSAAGYLEENMEERDAVVVSFYAFRPVNYYLKDAPITVLRGLSSQDTERAVENHTRMWVVFHDEQFITAKAKTANLGEWILYLDSKYKLLGTRRFPGGTTINDIPATEVTVNLYSLE